mgnify:FL=1
MAHHPLMTIFLFLFFWMGVPVYAGPASLHFERCPAPNTCDFLDGKFDVVLQSGQPRAEISDRSRINYGETAEFALEILVPATGLLENQNGSIVLAQLHAENSQSPVFALRLKATDECQLTLRHLTEILVKSA